MKHHEIGSKSVLTVELMESLAAITAAVHYDTLSKLSHSDPIMRDAYVRNGFHSQQFTSTHIQCISLRNVNENFIDQLSYSPDHVGYLVISYLFHLKKLFWSSRRVKS